MWKIEVRGIVGEPETRVEVGDIWWLPESVAGYPGGKNRYCLVVALEGPNRSVNPGRVHFVAGSTKSCGRPVIILNSGEATLNRTTYFGFWWSGDISISVLVGAGRLQGRITAERRSEIRAGICASKRVALKRLVGC